MPELCLMAGRTDSNDHRFKVKFNFSPPPILFCVVPEDVKRLFRIVIAMLLGFFKLELQLNQLISESSGNIVTKVAKIRTFETHQTVSLFFCVKDMFDL